MTKRKLPFSGAALLVLLACLPPAGLNAQPTFTPEEMAARRQSVVTLEQHIAQRKERLADIAADLRTLDERVEEGVTDVVEMLAKITDSPDSRVRVATVKADVITGLRKTIEYYDQNRNVIREQLRTGKTDLPAETLRADLAKFDERIDVRIRQIAELAKSFPDPQELEKYVVTAESTWAGGWFGWGWSAESVEISEDWKQNRRDSRHTARVRDGLTEGLNQAIANLDRRNAYLKEKLKEANLPETERRFYESDIVRNEALIQQRQQELDDFSTLPTAETNPVESGEAHHLDQVVRSARDDLREDFFAIFRKYAELNRARAEIKALEDNLAARKEWLEKNG